MIKITDRIWEVGAAHPDLAYFDCLMPTPFGTTYNAYLIKGDDKTCLIDTVEPEYASVLLDNLAELGVERLDYLICLHTEQDHSGSYNDVRRRYPDVQILGNAKTCELMVAHHTLSEDEIGLIKPDDRLELGGATLRFIMTPFAHWPDNYMAYLEEEEILFSTDLFGSHYAADDPANPDETTQINEAKTYYAEIMMPFRPQLAKYTASVRALAPRMIAPAHGPIWHQPERILDKYERWTSNAVVDRVVIPFVSMHGSTRLMVERLAQRLASYGLKVTCYDLGSERCLRQTCGELLHDLVNAAALVVATPTVLGGAHPNILYVAALASALRPKTAFFGLIGSYGWGTQVEKQVTALTSGIRAECLPSVLIKGKPDSSDHEKIDTFADELAEKIKAYEPKLP